jgi:hypothetical protein
MTWKSYAAVSGATALATWIASYAPSSAPAGDMTVPPPRAEAIAAAASDIEEETARLQARLRAAAVYREPERNPFRFGVPGPGIGTAGDPGEPLPPAEPFVFEPPPPSVSLAGIAEEGTGERVERTAVLSSPAGVLLVREGDVVLGQYRVVRVEGGAVELVTLADGSTLRLTLTP